MQGLTPHAGVGGEVYRHPMKLAADGFGRGEPDGAEIELVAEGRHGYPLTMVEWQDAWFAFEQASADDAASEYLVRTVGFLVREGPRFVSLAQEVLPEGEGFRAVTHIPLRVVERVVPLHSDDV